MTNNNNNNPNNGSRPWGGNRNKFSGHNKDGMEGYVITDTGSISQQFDTFYTALKIYAGTKDYLAGSAVELLEDITESSLMPKLPSRSKYLMPKPGQEDKDDP